MLNILSCPLFLLLSNLKSTVVHILSVLAVSQVAHGVFWVYGIQITVRSSHSQKNRHSRTYHVMKLQDILSTLEFHIQSESKIDEIAIRNQIEPIGV